MGVQRLDQERQKLIRRKLAAGDSTQKIMTEERITWETLKAVMQGRVEFQREYYPNRKPDPLGPRQQPVAPQADIKSVFGSLLGLED